MAGGVRRATPPVRRGPSSGRRGGASGAAGQGSGGTGAAGRGRAPRAERARSGADAPGSFPGRVMRWCLHLVLAAVAGVGLWASFPDVDAWYLTIPSLALLIALVERHGAPGAALVASVAGWAFWIPHISWVPLATGGGSLPWVALAATQVVALAAWGAFVRLARRAAWTDTVWGNPLVHAVVWVAVEQLRCRVPWSGFPWGVVAYPQVNGPLGHLAPWGGTVLVSAAVVVVAALLRRAVDPLSIAEARRRRGKVVVEHVPDVSGLPGSAAGERWWSRPACLGLAVVIAFAPGLLALPTAQEDGALRLAAIQGNVEAPGGRTYAEEGHVTANHAAETHAMLDSGEHADLIVWGEGALDRDPRVSGLVGRITSEAVEAADVPVIVGFNEAVPERHVIHNLIGPWYPGSGLDAEALYGKQVPVPFGEYIPMRSLVSSLATEAAQVRDDMEGMDNVSRMDVRLGDGRTVALTVGICFEVAHEAAIAEGVRAGGEIIVIPSNNYHFRTSAEAGQQAQILRFRSLEFSRAAVQVSTTGESMMTRPDGSVLAVSGREVAAHLVETLPLRTSLTPAAHLGAWPGWLVIVAGAGCVVLGVRKRPGRQERR